MKDPFVVSPEQKITLEYLRKRLAEWGYLIFPVATYFQRTEYDFIALPKEMPRRFVRVRPTAGGSIVVQSFAARALYRRLTKRIRKLPGLVVPVRWGGSQLPYAKVRPEWWKDFIPKEHWVELNLLGLH